jgi:hypothetical protein
MSDAPIRIGHPDTAQALDICGCCDGIAVSTLQPIWNRPNLSAIAYRAGTHAQFKASMLTALASAEHAPLADLKTRDNDDFTIALIDAWAGACEVLSFYQERYANEAYIGTALERLSIGEIARLIGYRLHPGAAAETDLVFLMDDPPGAEPDVADLTIPLGTRVQSQPGPEETPQVFETLAPLQARVAWNRFRPRQNRRIAPDTGDLGAWLQGQATGLQLGDAILIVGDDRVSNAGSELWDFRRVTKVQTFPDLDRTFVTWDRPLGSINPPGEAAQAGHRFYHLRSRASLFGHNAPHPGVLTADQRNNLGYNGLTIAAIAKGPGGLAAAINPISDWDFDFPASNKIALDAVYKGFVKGGWVVLTLPNGLVELYSITNAAEDAEARWGVSGKTTLLTLAGEHLSSFENGYRTVGVYGESVELPLAETPLYGWIAGSTVELDRRAADLPEERLLMFAGRRAQVEVIADTLTLTADDGVSTRTLFAEDRLTLMAEPAAIPASADLLWRLRDADGFEGTVEAPETAFQAVEAADDTETIAETAILAEVQAIDAAHSRLVLAEALTHAYDRRNLSIHANVARASHGESATEILGGGDPSRPHQRFQLKQNPVTQLLAPTESGVASTLELRADGVKWREVPFLYGQGPRDRVFATALDDDGKTTIRFGDGVEGARPPAGRDNLVADYRVGLGLAGNVRAGQLSLAVDQPLGLRSVQNPLAALGGDDPETTADARRSAPIYTLTLGRLVSITDYRDFALGYPGIEKADARWVWTGETRRIIVTVAGANGAMITEDGPTYPALLQAYRDLGDPFVQFQLLSYVPAYFRLGIRVAIDPDYENDAVLSAVEAALRAAFSFEARGFAQPVALSAVAAKAHEVAGVLAVDIDKLYRTAPPQADAIAHPLLAAQPGRLSAIGELLPAEILTLSPDPLDQLEAMS